MPSCRYYYLKLNKRMKVNMKISHAFSIKIEWSHSTKSLERGFLATQWYLIYIFATRISDAMIF